MRRGIINISFKNFENAKKDFEKAKELEPHNKEVLKYLEEIKKDEKKKKRKDYYKLLEINPDADDNELKRGFRKMAKKWHPDKNFDDPTKKDQSHQMFQDINQAYNILSDAKKRKLYDAGLDPEDPNAEMEYTYSNLNYGDLLKYARECKF